MSNIVIIGVDVHTTEIAAAARLAGFSVRAIYDDNAELWGRSIQGTIVRGPISQAVSAGASGVLAFDDPCRRQMVVEQLDIPWAMVAHPKAIVDKFATVLPGSVLLEGAVLQPGARVGAHVIVGPKATVAHDCVLEDFVRLRPGVQLAGFVQVGRCCCLENGAVVIPNVRLGAWSWIGPGSVVIRDLPDYARAAGVPARPLAVPMPMVADVEGAFERARQAS